MQKSGDFVVLAGLNAENEILHTLAFLAGVTIWSQVRTWFPPCICKDTFLFSFIVDEEILSSVL